ncbi:MAG: glycosyltransferase family 39 protein, partial [Chloroflexota bacterium]|nr:glycosyltransferase family 39 protein [Chloroflexota bacterium]
PPVLEEGGGRGFGHHAPLYYAYGALVSFWVGENDLHVWSERHNPFFGYRFGEVGRDNKNLYIHPDSDALGRSDTWLGIRVVRLASVVLGVITLWAIYQTGREIFPSRPEIALGAAGLAAFIPEFLFISGAVNDDNGATLFGALALWVMMLILRKGPSWRRCTGLGLALGMGWLSKLTIVALVPTAIATLAVVAWRDRSWRELLRFGLMTVGVMAILVLPWLARQTILYGDPTGTSREMSEWGLREEPVRLDDLGPDLYWLRTSFWGRLGYNQIPLAGWIYTLLDVMTLLAFLGFVGLVASRLRASSPSLQSAITSLVSTTRSSQLMILIVALLLTFGPMVVRRFLRPMPNFGRYLFPVVPSIVILMVTGLSTWVRRRYHAHLAVGLTASMLAVGFAGLMGFLAPAYARPPIYEDGEVPEPGRPLDRTYLEDGRPVARLLGFDVEQQAVEPGQTTRVTLYWEVLSETDVNYVLFAQLFGREATKIGQRDTYPGLGHYPTSFWQPGEVILDEIPIPVASQAVAPSRLRLDVGLYERGAGRLTVTDSQRNVIDTATIGWLKLLAAEQPPSPAVSTDYRLGDAISLHGYDLERESERVLLALHWVSLTPVNRDYMVFVHLLDGEGNVVAQADGPPVGGDYPTSFWAPGETIVGQHMLDVEDLTPGTYELAVGMYLLKTGDRLPAADGDGQSLAHDVIPLTRVRLP